MTEEQEKALADFERAKAKCNGQKAGDKGAELQYGVAYQRLVFLGLRPQIKRKYRGR